MRFLPHVNFLRRTTHHYQVKLKIPDYFSKDITRAVDISIDGSTIGASKQSSFYHQPPLCSKADRPF